MNRTATTVFVVLTALSCMLLVYFLRMGWLEAGAIAKFSASTGFLATAISSGALRHRFGQVIFTGLVLSFAGDMFLINTSEESFLFGLGSFLLAHIAYITAFIGHGQSRKWVLLSAVPVIAIAVATLAWLAPHLPADLAMPVRLYTAVISLMVVSAFGARGAGAPSLVLAGALMFFVSDLSVAAQRIVVAEFPTFVWGLPLYYGGQISLAIGASVRRK
jgi:uncharacterized membrane protein YhhN